MSDQESFLSRWSRRKREVAEEEAQAPEPTAATPAPISDAPAEGSEAPFDPATLPPIESINALSDITAFLRDGVPAELTRAALRRVWTADPSIRDFVGLAENAWDFTDPNAMPGFGPLGDTEDVRRMIAQVVSQIGQAATPAISENRDDRPPQSKITNYSNAIEAPPQIDPSLDATTDEGDEQGDAELSTSVALQRDDGNSASQHEIAQAPFDKKQAPYRTHGRALPQ